MKRLVLAAGLFVSALQLPALAETTPDPGMVPVPLYTSQTAPTGVDPLAQFAADINARFVYGAQSRKLLSDATTALALRTTTVEGRATLLEARPIVPDLTSRVTTLEARAPVPGPAGVVPFYGSAGLMSGVKCWQGNSVTTTGGAYTISYATASFTAVPIVTVQAISPSSLLAGLVFATMTAPTLTSVSGVTALAGVGGLGGAGTTVMALACGK